MSTFLISNKAVFNVARMCLVSLLLGLAGCCSQGIPSARSTAVTPDALWRDLVANHSGADFMVEVRHEDDQGIRDGWLRLVTTDSHLVPDASVTLRAERHEAGPFDMSLPGSRRVLILDNGMKLQTMSAQGVRLRVTVRPVEPSR